MKRLITLLLVSQAVCALASSSLAVTITVNGTDDIYGAGHTTNPGGTQPTSFSFPAGSLRLTFSSVTGTVSLNSGGNFNDPDGVGAAVTTSSTTSYNGLSGITSPGAGELVGVFETATEPSGAGPASLDFTTVGTSFSSFSPLLNQVFYIGDGLTGDKTGSIQIFNVPTGATRLFLGISDAPGYNGSPGSYSDNSGTFVATFSVVPEPGTYAAVGLGLALVLAVHQRKRRLTREIR